MESDKELKAEIAGYCRISVDEELDRDNTSIENQKDIIRNYVKCAFPKCKLTFYADRDKSGYTFDQRDDYQKLRKRMMKGEIKILIVKDFSRFSRRNSKGLVELEDLRDVGVRIISIGDAIDYPTNDDWTAIQFRFLINEMPVTDASKKVRGVIRRKQEEGAWINTVPYGYVITNQKKNMYEIVPDEAEVIKEVFTLYNNGWGYKKIANYLTDKHIPTPRMKEKERIEARGDDYKRKYKKEWSIVTITGILTNDFYIGTLRQRKYQRKKINGIDEKLDDEKNIVFEKHHPAIIEDKVFLYTQEQLKARSTNNYRGIKKYDTSYSGFLFCGDCGERMFSMSRNDMEPAYVCGAYQRHGLKSCTSHHTRVDFLDMILKEYIKAIKENSKEIFEELEGTIASETDSVKENENLITLLEDKLQTAKDELKATSKRKIREITRNPEDENLIEETYSEIEQEIKDRIYGYQSQIESASNKRNDIIQANRVKKTVLDVFDSILKKEKLDKVDIALIVERIDIYADGRIDIKLKNDIDMLLRVGKLPNEVTDTNFNQDSIDSLLTTQYTQKVRNQRAKVYTVNVINSGDPLEIFTDREGEIILKKYSPIGEMTAFAKQYAESLAQVSGKIALIADRDQFIAAAGGLKNLLGKSISHRMEEKLNDREILLLSKADKNFVEIANEPIPDLTQYVSAPILAEGDVIGAVILAANNEKEKLGEVEKKLVLSAAGFLGRQMEQ